MNEKKVAFITCVNNEELYSECELYIRSITVPEGYDIELIPIRDSKSMCEGYNRGGQKSDAKYKVYLHQDTLIVNKNLINDMINIFRNDKIGVIGVIGCKNLPMSGVWWDGLRTYGRVLHASEPESVVDSVCRQPEEGKLYEEVEACDGLFLALQYDILWREDLFNGYHFYDTSMCLEAKRRGLKVAVPQQGEHFWCIHCPKEKPLEPIYKKYRRIFAEEYGKELSPEV